MGIYITLAFCFVALYTPSHAELDEKLKQQVGAMTNDVKRIHDYLLRGGGRGQTYEQLAILTDTYGPRMVGSQALNDSIDYLKSDAESRSLSGVSKLPFQTPLWVRGDDTVTLITPRDHKLDCLALGGTVAGNITASVLVVKSFEELDLRATEVSGKILVYNAAWLGSYGETVAYRYGAWRAAQHGAVGVLVRSITDYSLYTPHTGIQRYDEGHECPVAAITVEDAELMQRLQDRNVPMTVNMDIRSHPDGNTTSSNVVAEITGSDKPLELVMFGGHIDSWDVGTGAMDDAGGVMVSRQVLATIQALNLTPKRTMRFIAWSSEENGGYGSKSYFDANRAAEDKFSLVMETDTGTFTPYGVGFTGSLEARELIQYILNTHLAVINVTIVDEEGGGVDSGPWMDVGVPATSLLNDITDSKYFRYHHTKADTMTMQNPDDLDLCAVVYTVLAWVVANLDDLLPRCTADPLPNCPNDGQTTKLPDTTKEPSPSGTPVWSAQQPVIIGLIVLCYATRF